MILLLSKKKILLHQNILKISKTNERTTYVFDIFLFRVIQPRPKSNLDKFEIFP